MFICCSFTHRYAFHYLPAYFALAHPLLRQHFSGRWGAEPTTGRQLYSVFCLYYSYIYLYHSTTMDSWSYHRRGVLMLLAGVLSTSHFSLSLSHNVSVLFETTQLLVSQPWPLTLLSFDVRCVDHGVATPYLIFLVLSCSFIMVHGPCASHLLL